MLTEKDKELIEKAGEIPSQVWYKVDDLIEQAESEEARDKLRYLRSKLRFEDEDAVGLL